MLISHYQVNITTFVTFSLKLDEIYIPMTMRVIYSQNRKNNVKYVKGDNYG